MLYLVQVDGACSASITVYSQVGFKNKYMLIWTITKDMLFIFSREVLPTEMHRKCINAPGRASVFALTKCLPLYKANNVNACFFKTSNAIRESDRQT